jgi:hypothetical protein
MDEVSSVFIDREPVRQTSTSLSLGALRAAGVVLLDDVRIRNENRPSKIVRRDPTQVGARQLSRILQEQNGLKVERPKPQKARDDYSTMISARDLASFMRAEQHAVYCEKLRQTGVAIFTDYRSGLIKHGRPPSKDSDNTILPFARTQP